MPLEKIQYTVEQFAKEGRTYRPTVTVLPEHLQPPTVQKYGWTEQPADDRPLPRGTSEQTYTNDIPQRAAEHVARDDQRSDALRRRGLELSRQVQADVAAAKPPAETRRPDPIPARKVQDPARDEAIREYVGRLLAESGGRISIDDALALAENLYEKTGGLMDKRLGRPDSPAEQLAEIERQLDEMEAPGRREHEERATQYARIQHRQGKSPSWAECLDATRPKRYGRSEPSDFEVRQYAERQINAGRRISFAEAQLELCGA